MKMKSEIAEFLQANPGQDSLSLYHLPDKHLITPFLIVFNSLPCAVDIILSEMDWKSITKTPKFKVVQATQEATLSTWVQQRHFLFADYHNTS
jgi:hypothetical protein